MMGRLLSEEGGEGGEGGGAAAAAAAVADDPSTPPSFDATGIFNADGGFEAIGSKYANDDTDAEYIDRHFKGKTPAQLAKILKDNQTAARAKSLTYPGAEATDDDKARWNAGAGVPEKVEQVMPENFEEFQNATGWTPEVATPVIQAMIDAGTPGPAITAAIAAVQAAASGQGEQWAEQAQEARAAGETEVREAFGAEFDGKINGAMVAVEKLGLKSGLSQEQIDDVKAGVQEIRNPAITRMFANLADSISEAAYRGPGAAGMADGFRGPAEEASAIMNDSSHPMHEKYMSGDRRVNDHVDGLLDKAHN